MDRSRFEKRLHTTLSCGWGYLAWLNLISDCSIHEQINLRAAAAIGCLLRRCGSIAACLILNCCCFQKVTFTVLEVTRLLTLDAKITAHYKRRFVAATDRAQVRMSSAFRRDIAHNRVRSGAIGRGITNLTIRPSGVPLSCVCVCVCVCYRRARVSS